jgi:hypothetical protein
VAAWLSEKVLVSSNLTEGGGFFPREKPPPGHGCVCMSPRGLTVGWWKEESTLFRPPPRGQHGFESRREGRPCCVCHYDLIIFVNFVVQSSL